MSLVSATPRRDALKDSIARAIELIDFKTNKPIKTVVIKPNLNYYWEPSAGCTTDPQVVAALIDHLRDQYGNSITIRIAEADASAMKTRHVFPILGYTDLAAEKKVELLNLSNDHLCTEKVSVAGHDIEFAVPSSLANSDLFINVPKLKAWRATKITCAMKNVFGCIGTPRKFVYHPILHEAIVGINRILRPNLTIVDGLIALGRYPVRLDLIMASVDVFSIDWVAAQILGHNPRSIKFLKIAVHEKLGTPLGILTRGEDLAQFREKIPKQGFTLGMFQGLQFRLLRLYRTISGDVVPPFLEAD